MKIPATLNARFVDTVTRPGRYGDGRGGYGLCLNVRRMTNGRTSKSWVQRIRPNGRPTYIGIGRYPFVTLAEARKLALGNAIMLAKGMDPRAGGVPTFAAALDAVIAIQAPTWRTAKSEAQWRASMRDHAAALMPMPVDTITSSHVLASLVPIWNAKRATARRVKQRIGAVMKWAIAEGHRTDNPIDAIGPALPKTGSTPEHHRALPYDRVGGVLAGVRAAKAWEGSKLALVFLTLTAARSGEVRGARWEEIDGDLWTVPADRMKAGREHRIPLSPAALGILDEARELGDGTGFVFPSVRGGAIGDATLGKLLHQIVPDATVHGMRSSFRDWAGERTHTPHAVMEAALAHVVKSATERAYARSDHLERRRALMDAWARYLEPRTDNVRAIA